MEIKSPKGRRFSSIQEVQNYIESDIQERARKVLEEVAEEIKSTMEDLILEFYSQYTPEYYERTGQLLEAVRKAESKVYKTRDGWRIHIKVINTDAMDSMWAEEDEDFNTYMSFTGQATYGGKRYTDWVVEWVDNGSENDRVWGHEPIHFSEKINQMLDEKVQAGILREMRRAGFNLIG